MNLTVADIKEALNSLKEDTEIQFDQDQNSENLFKLCTVYEVKGDSGSEFINITKENLFTIISEYEILDIKQVTVLNLHALKLKKNKEHQDQEKIYRQKLEEAQNKKDEHEVEDVFDNDEDEDDDESEEMEDNWVDEFENDESDDEDDKNDLESETTSNE